MNKKRKKYFYKVKQFKVWSSISKKPKIYTSSIKGTVGNFKSHMMSNIEIYPLEEQNFIKNIIKVKFFRYKRKFVYIDSITGELV